MYGGTDLVGARVGVGAEAGQAPGRQTAEQLGARDSGTCTRVELD
jgi:hypothetical protein